MVLPLLLAGPTGRGETLEDLIAEHERQVNIIRQSIGRESKEAHVQDSEPDVQLTESSRRSRLTKLYDAIPSQQPLLLKSRVKKMVSHSNLTSPSPRTAVCQEHQQEQNRDFKPGPTNPRSPIDTVSRVTVANEQPLQSTCLVSSANSCHRPSLAGDGLSSLALSTPLFPATQAFRACAEVLVTPLGQEFFLDPLKLGSTKVLMASTSPVPTRGSSDGPVRILDLGGLDAGRSEPEKHCELCWRLTYHPSRHRSLYRILGRNTRLQRPKSHFRPSQEEAPRCQILRLHRPFDKQSRISAVPGCLCRYRFFTVLAQRCSIQTFGHRYGPQSRTEGHEGLPRRVSPPPGARRPLRVHLLPRWAHQHGAPYYRD
jgi:hypothetical protein